MGEIRIHVQNYLMPTLFDIILQTFGNLYVLP